MCFEYCLLLELARVLFRTKGGKALQVPFKRATYAVDRERVNTVVCLNILSKECIPQLFA